MFNRNTDSRITYGKNYIFTVLGNVFINIYRNTATILIVTDGIVT